MGIYFLIICAIIHILMQSNSVSTHQACASCKHQRKKCESNCPLAPFFPSNDMDRFQAVHKVFGVSNTLKMIKNIVSQHERRKAVESIIWEAQCREADPVNGCRAKYLELQHEMNMLMEKNKMLQNEMKMIMENNKMLMENNNLLQNENSFLKSQYFSQFHHSNNNISISNANYIQQYEQGLIQAVHSTEDPLSTYQRLGGGLIKQKEKRNSLAQLSRSQINQQQYVVEQLGQINLRGMNANSEVVATNTTSDTTTSGAKTIQNPNWMR